MTAVTDTTAVTSLLKIGKAHLLGELFQPLLAPRAVAKELLRYHSGLPDFLDIRDLYSQATANQFRQQLDLGESEAIALALEVSADVLIIDERKGRRLAEGTGLRCIGLPAVAMLAKTRKLIDSVGELFDELESKGHFRLADEVRADLLRQAGESS